MEGSYSCESEEGRCTPPAVYVEVWGHGSAHITSAGGAFYSCVKNKQESGSEIVLRVTQPPVDTSEDFQKLHSAHVGMSAHL